MNAIDAVIKAFSYKADINSNKWNKECNLSPILTIFVRVFFINNKIEDKTTYKVQTEKN